MSGRTRVQKRGTITIPSELRRKWHLVAGAEVVFEDTGDGILIRRAEDAELLRAIDLVGEKLKERGVTFEQLLSEGERIREALYRERYGEAGD